MHNSNSNNTNTQNRKDYGPRNEFFTGEQMWKIVEMYPILDKDQDCPIYRSWCRFFWKIKDHHSYVRLTPYDKDAEVICLAAYRRKKQKQAKAKALKEQPIEPQHCA